jgi:response regulator RpfG family c-di-GMP phosphodiesterase
MPVWLLWVIVGLGAWVLLSLVAGVILGRGIFLVSLRDREIPSDQLAEESAVVSGPQAAGGRAAVPPRSVAKSGLRILVVDDDEALRLLLRTTFELEGLEVDEAESAEAAVPMIAAVPPSGIVLDIGMPGLDGLTFCAQLKADPRTSAIPVVLLSGLGEEAELRALATGAEAFLRKPFSPLELLDSIQRLTSGVPLRLPPVPSGESQTQLLAYAADLRRLLEAALQQQSLLQSAYRETVAALATALAAKDPGTGAHSQRVVGYASELTLAFDPTLLDDPSLEYGFLLHDLGKLGVPEGILQKPGPLSMSERREMEKHARFGTDMLSNVPVLAGEGMKVVRSHHERWDGSGYPDGLEGATIPAGARIFAVADALDAITSDRPYRRASGWDVALAEIRGQSSRQFDPEVVETLERAEQRLHEVYLRLLNA